MFGLLHADANDGAATGKCDGIAKGRLAQQHYFGARNAAHFNQSQSNFLVVEANNTSADLKWKLRKGQQSKRE
jgi:hypothetical protein